MDVNFAFSTNDDFNYRNLFKRTVNMCQFYKNRKKEIILNAFYTEFARIADVPTRCPFGPVINFVTKPMKQMNSYNYSYAFVSP